jgi:REP element-mobilizing transposase RayT
LAWGSATTTWIGGADILVCPAKEKLMKHINDPELRISRRRLPHWKLEGSIYFVTFRLISGALTALERQVVLHHLRSGDPKFYTLIAAVVMPDHVHLLVKPNDGIDLSRVMKGSKGVSGRKINKLRGAHGNLWQDESYDRIVRDQEELDEKLQYMLMNPVKEGLVEEGWEYDGWYFNPASID